MDLYTLFVIIVVWNLVPVILTASLPVPLQTKIDAIRCFMFDSCPKGLAVLLPDLLAPIVVPIALLFTKREDDHLPKLFSWWDNDVSINGDREEYWASDYTGTTYYAKAHPRSFWARFVWLGFRNRASRLSQMLGYTHKEGDTREQFGDPKTGRDHEGWALNRAGDVYQVYLVKKLGPLCVRINYGYKVWGILGDGRKTANVVNISFSLISWTGK